MYSVLTLRDDAYAPISETLNLSARGTNEAQKIAAWYAESKDYGYWQLKFNKADNDAPRLIRKGNQLRVTRG